MSASKTASEGFIVSNNRVAVTVDDVAFPCALADRVTGRTQTLLYGTIKVGGYRTGGVPCNLAISTSPGRFPNENYRLIMQPDTTFNYYAVYIYATKLLKVFSGVGTEVTNNTDLKAIVFPFLAVGE